MKDQKRAVIELVQRELPNFVLYSDIALVMLTSDQLELIKKEIGDGLYNGTIKYSKTDKSEAYQYARSMVMHHLKKARELNGDQSYGNAKSAAHPIKKDKLGINMDSLPDDLKAYVSKLV